MDRVLSLSQNAIEARARTDVVPANAGAGEYDSPGPVPSRHADRLPCRPQIAPAAGVGAFLRARSDRLPPLPSHRASGTHARSGLQGEGAALRDPVPPAGAF